MFVYPQEASCFKDLVRYGYKSTVHQTPTVSQTSTVQRNLSVFTKCPLNLFH